MRPHLSGTLAACTPSASELTSLTLFTKGDANEYIKNLQRYISADPVRFDEDCDPPALDPRYAGLGNLSIIRLRLSSGPFASSVQFWKWKIHKVFPHFQNFRLSQNPSLSALAEWIRASLEIKPDIWFPRSITSNIGIKTFFSLLTAVDSEALA